jgi:tRNA threonylcarbamoyladenosine biosynthesis protein TsaB
VLVLAIETSSPAGSVALLQADRCLAERPLELGVRHGQTLIPEIGRLLAEGGYQPRACELIVVSTGPGSFTGLRVGIVCAKTLAYVTGCPIAAVDTHLAIATNSPEDVGKVAVVSSAQRGDLFVSTFARLALGDFESVEPLHSVTQADWLQRLSADDVVSGPGCARLFEGGAQGVRVLESSHWRPQAGVVGRLGYRQALSGNTADPWTLEPSYLRLSSAEEKWDLRLRS